jgi:hypothetical protein
MARAQSPAETDVDRERAVMARAPGDLKPFWPKRLGPVYRTNKPLAERLAAVAGAFWLRAFCFWHCVWE